MSMLQEVIVGYTVAPECMAVMCFQCPSDLTEQIWSTCGGSVDLIFAIGWKSLSKFYVLCSILCHFCSKVYEVVLEKGFLPPKAMGLLHIAISSHCGDTVNHR